jgi:hypothetical protein
MNHFFKVLLYCLCLHVEACAQKIFGTIFMAKHRDLPDIIPSIIERFQPLIKNRMILAGFNAGFSIENTVTQELMPFQWG